MTCLLNGVMSGGKLMLELFPTLIGLFVAVGMLSSSGLIDFVSEKVYAIFKGLIMYKEIVPVALLRPISGNTAMAMGIEVMQKAGVDSNIGQIVSCIMGAGETTIYVIAIYGSKVKNKNIKPAVYIGFIADFICIMSCVLALKIGLI